MRGLDTLRRQRCITPPPDTRIQQDESTYPPIHECCYELEELRAMIRIGRFGLLDFSNAPLYCIHHSTNLKFREAVVAGND
jgi:hypothetical protein